jgi:hypothetical protein
MHQFKLPGRWQDGPVGSYYTGIEISLMQQACSKRRFPVLSGEVMCKLCTTDLAPLHMIF